MLTCFVFLTCGRIFCLNFAISFLFERSGVNMCLFCLSLYLKELNECYLEMFLCLFVSKDTLYNPDNQF